MGNSILYDCFAQVAELADALGSGPSEGNFIGVQVPFWAKKKTVVSLCGFNGLFFISIGISSKYNA